MRPRTFLPPLVLACLPLFAPCSRAAEPGAGGKLGERIGGRCGGHEGGVLNVRQCGRSRIDLAS